MPKYRPTLIVQTVCFDPSDREASTRLGADLYGLLTRPADDPLAFGAGIPVYSGVTPENVDPDAAETVVLLPVLGKQTYMTSRDAVLDQIREWHEKLGSGHVIPVPNSTNWRGVEDKLPGKNLLTELYGEGDRRRLTLDEIVLAVLRLFESDADKMRLFVSHAKADMGATKNAAKAIHDYVVSDTTGSAFFDVTDLDAGESLSEQLDQSVSKGVFMMVRSDSYSTRSWCLQEMLSAKRAGLPTLTVEILKQGEVLSSAYGGNGPSVVWDDSPEAVVSRAMVECLRAAYFGREAERIKKSAGLPSGTRALCRPPELLDLVQGPLGTNRVEVAVHPDPELSVVVRNLLYSANPKLNLMTPTTAFRRIVESDESTVESPFENMQVALSLSDSPDVDGDSGFTKNHVDDATVYLARCLISAGAQIAYGGDFRTNGYTEILSDLISSYNQTAASSSEFLHSYLGAVLSFEDASDNLQITAHHLGSAPMAEEAMLPHPSKESHPFGLYFSDMRRVMAKHTSARVVLGGASVPGIEEIDQKGYGGRYPGVVEEAWRTLEAGQPLYIVGGFGGGAGVVADLLEDKPTPEVIKDVTWTKHESFAKRAAEIDADPYREKLGLPKTMEDLGEVIRSQGKAVLSDDDASVAWNGLTVAENHELFRTRDPLTISSLVFKGLRAVRRKRVEGQLEIELVNGSITAARSLDAVAVATFDRVPLGGAGAALDRAVAGRASLAREEGEALIDLNTDDVAADWLYLASLGEMDDLGQMPEKIEEAARNTADRALRHGFSRLGVVAYGGNVVDDVETVASAMISGFGDLAGQTTIVWFESDKKRFDALHAVLQKEISDGGDDEEETRGGKKKGEGKNKKKKRKVSLTTRRQVETVPQAPIAREAELFLNVGLVGDELSVTAVPPAGTGMASTFHSKLDSATLDAFSKGEGYGARTTPGLATLETRGRELAGVLFGDEAPELLSRCRNAKVVIIHDVPSSKLPFELLRADADNGDPLRPAADGGINRRLAVSDVKIEQLLGKPPHGGKLRVLLVVNPLGDLAGTEREAKEVKKVLSGKENVELVELWNDKATKEAVLDELAQADVLHYGGHAFFNGPGEEESGLNLADDKLTLKKIKKSHFPIRLAFVNACESGRVRGDVKPVTGSASFAEFFLRTGIEAYLGTYWQVSDAGAAQFAANVYLALAGGESLDKAVRIGRTKLVEANLSDWANYMLFGDGRFRLIARN